MSKGAKESGPRRIELEDYEEGAVKLIRSETGLLLIVVDAKKFNERSLGETKLDVVIPYGVQSELRNPYRFTDDELFNAEPY